MNRHEGGKKHIRDLGEWLKQSGLRVTVPRKAILTVLVDNHGPFTAEEVHKLVTRRVCDLATIYRSLISLEEKDLVRRCEFGDGVARFELNHPDHHHHHLVCTKCRSVEIVDDEEIEEIDRFARKRGYADVSHILEFFGVCPNCR